MGADLPARYEGDHLCVGLLVEHEAKRMRGFQLYNRRTKHDSREMHLAALQERLWCWLKSGWARISEDDVMVYWCPEARAHVPMSQQLHDYYTEQVEDVMSWVAHMREQRAIDATVSGDPEVEH